MSRMDNCGNSSDGGPGMLLAAIGGDLDIGVSGRTIPNIAGGHGHHSQVGFGYEGPGGMLGYLAGAVCRFL